MEEIQETQGYNDDDDVEITQVVTRDARGIDSHGSARDTLRAMNSQAIGGDRREPSVQPSPATIDLNNLSQGAVDGMSLEQLARLSELVRNAQRKRGLEDEAIHTMLLNLTSRRTDGCRDACAHVPRVLVALADVAA